MSKLEFVKKVKFNNIRFDCYLDPDQQDKTDYWLTGEQIGQLLEYPDPAEAINRLHKRYKERFDKFSRVNELSTPDGNTQQVTVYNFKGLLEICRRSPSQPVANDIWDWLMTSAVNKIFNTGGSNE